MGQFASIISLTWDEILTLTKSNITDDATAIQDLSIIKTALTPRATDPPSSFPPALPAADGSPISVAIAGAVTAARDEAIFLFDAIYPSIGTAPFTDYGTVLNYTPIAGDCTTLAAQLTLCFNTWGLQASVSSVPAIAQQLQIQVINSKNNNGICTAIATYGRAATNNTVIADPVITVECLFWVAAFGIFSTGTKPDGTKNYAVIYGFSAANGTLQGTIQ